MVRAQAHNEALDLRPRLAGRRAGVSALEIEAWIASDMRAVRSLVDQLTRLIEGSRCVAGHEPSVELALLEAVTNAVVHGNRLDPHRLVQVDCRCDLSRGLFIVVKDQGQGFDPDAFPNPLTIGTLQAGRGRGIHRMKLAMDEVKFENNGAAVRMWKAAGREPRTRMQPNPGVSATSSPNHVAALSETYAHSSARQTRI